MGNKIGMDYRKLTEDEMRRLDRQGCTAEDWNSVEVCIDTDVRYIESVRFSGEVRIGAFRRMITLPGGAKEHTGIREARLHNVSVGDDCYIYRVYIANYDIAPLCVVAHCGILATTNATSFGAGVEVNVADETGGRRIVIHPHMSAQEAYLQAFTDVGLREMAARHAEKSSRGSVGQGAVLVYCTRVTNVRIGEGSRIEGVTELADGTVDDGVFVGGGVTARSFVFECGSRIADGARLNHCFVGEATSVGNGFAASHSFFASNCQAENGEACSLFAGPFTVTHHKSTLLIGAVCSFFNAGSGTNQSNHAYKLGPIHYGVLERGCKTASGAHIVWPARIGAFTMVMGRIPPHTDASVFPFSYLIGGTERPHIVPAIALRSIGTLRDVRKWPQRDRRSAGSASGDIISCNPFTPYVLQRMIDGERMLSLLSQTMEKEGKTEALLAGGLIVSLKNARRGAELYRLAADCTLGSMARKCLADGNAESFNQSALSACGDWCDLMGLQTPITEIKEILNDVASRKINTPRQLDNRLKNLHARTEEYTWAWAWHHLRSAYPDADTSTMLRLATEKGDAARARLQDLLRADALRDIEGGVHMEYGLLGDDVDAEGEKHALRDATLRNALNSIDEAF